MNIDEYKKRVVSFLRHKAQFAKGDVLDAIAESLLHFSENGSEAAEVFDKAIFGKQFDDLRRLGDL